MDDELNELRFPVAYKKYVVVSSSTPWTTDQCDEVIEWMKFFKERIARRDAALISSACSNARMAAE